MTRLWTRDDAVAAAGGTSEQDWAATGVSIDTRTLQPGDLFVALADVRDGHDFVSTALQAGAAAALVSKIPEDVPPNAPLWVVPDVLGALENLGKAARARMSGRVAAITGSVGKTSTKEMLRAALTGQGRVHASVASYNNHWGVPLTLARMPANTDFAVIEIGMNHPGEIAPLAQMTRPDVVMITTVAAAHLEAFDSIEGITMEKGSICSGLTAGGVAVLNADIDQADLLMSAAQTAKAKIVTFGQTPGTDYRLDRLRIAENTTVGEARAKDDAFLIKVASQGEHFVLNGLGAVAVATALGADLAQSLCGLGEWTPPAGRGAREVICLDPVETQLTLTLLDDAYNANPASMAAALAVLASTQVDDDIGRVGKGRRIAFLGDMKELGENATQLHAAIAELDALEQVDTVHCIGPLMAGLYDALPIEKRGRHTQTAAEMVPYVRAALDAGDAVLAKGSLSMGLAQIVDAVRKMEHAEAKAGVR